jgi:DNA-binding response OmpR family regulator
MQTLGAARESETVVMVDDDEDLRLIVRDVLEDAGFEVLECENLATAFALLSGIIPDVVLLDRDLPDGNGLTVARWMRDRHAYDGARIIGLSGRNNPSDVEASLAAGCDAVVAKPCTASVLVAEIRATSPRANAVAPDVHSSRALQHKGSHARQVSTDSQTGVVRDLHPHRDWHPRSPYTPA